MKNNFREKILAEIDVVSKEIDSDPDQERATLEGWYEALSWVLVEFDKGI